MHGLTNGLTIVFRSVPTLIKQVRSQLGSPAKSFSNDTNIQNRVHDVIRKIRDDNELKHINPTSAHGKIIYMLAAQLPDDKKDDVLELNNAKKIEQYLKELENEDVILTYPEPNRENNFKGASPYATQDFHKNTMKNLRALYLEHKNAVAISKYVHKYPFSKRSF